MKFSLSGTSQLHFDSASTYSSTMSHVIDNKGYTCRRWKNSTEGCLSSPQSCTYLHRYTGIMSPTLPVTCWHWKNDYCAFVQDDCLYSHFDTAAISDAPRHSGSFRTPTCRPSVLSSRSMTQVPRLLPS